MRENKRELIRALKDVCGEADEVRYTYETFRYGDESVSRLKDLKESEDDRLCLSDARYAAVNAFAKLLEEARHYREARWLTETYRNSERVRERIYGFCNENLCKSRELAKGSVRHELLLLYAAEKIDRIIEDKERE